MRVLVCGGRYFDQWRTLATALDERQPISLVIHGGARGADQMAGKWARSRGIPECVFPANWTHHGKMAGPIRNAAMLTHGKPDLVVAFAGGFGTRDMVSRAFAANLPVHDLAGCHG